MFYAIIENGIVVNITVGCPFGIDGIPIEGLDVSIGDSYANGVFTKAEPLPPEEAINTEALIACVMDMAQSSYDRLPAAMRAVFDPYRI